MDTRYMGHALILAERSAGLASPNPQVGCVLVRDGVILGEGAHIYERRDHAEVVALKQAAAQSFDVRGATAYVTLEPCSHQGRTGPCADALIAARIARCVIATVDPNPQVSGGGLAKLQAAGVQVAIGILQTQARRLNDPFAWSIQHSRPMVTLKSALSVDGRLAPLPANRAPAAPHWLTGPVARAQVQRLRHASDAILTGIGTVLADDPALTDRTGEPRRRPLLRVVLDRRLQTPATSKLIRSADRDLLLVCGPDASEERSHELEQAGAEILRLGGGDPLGSLLDELHRRQILSVLLEAGPGLNGAFLAADLVQRAILFYAETELGEGSLPFANDVPSPFLFEQRLRSITRETFGRDVCVSGLLHDPWSADQPGQATLG